MSSIAGGYVINGSDWAASEAKNGSKLAVDLIWNGTSDAVTGIGDLCG